MCGTCLYAEERGPGRGWEWERVSALAEAGVTWALWQVMTWVSQQTWGTRGGDWATWGGVWSSALCWSWWSGEDRAERAGIRAS